MLVLEDGSEVVLLVPDAAGTTSDLPAPHGVQSLWKRGALHSAKSTPARIRERAYPLADGQSGAEEKAAELRQVWRGFEGGRFEVEGSGGNAGMLMFTDRNGRQWFVGSFRGDAESFVSGVNLALVLLYEEKD